MKFKIGDIVGMKNNTASTYIITKIDMFCRKYYIKSYPMDNFEFWCEEDYMIEKRYIIKGVVEEEEII